MACMDARVLGRRNLEVLVYGAGRSLDNRHISRLPAVSRSRVAIGDIMRLRADSEFVDLSMPARRRFDVVVACEVIEHFTDPRAEFSRLFSYVAADGLLVCSTNIYDGTNLSRHGYICGRGHVSYYSPQSLRVLARKHRVQLDFRVPAIATARVGPRKRYVLFSRSTQVMTAAADYFGAHLFAPSESDGNAAQR